MESMIRFLSDSAIMKSNERYMESIIRLMSDSGSIECRETESMQNLMSDFDSMKLKNFMFCFLPFKPYPVVSQFSLLLG